MTTDNYIPAATAEKLNTEFPKGTRHQAKIDIAIPLIGNGLPAAAVFATLRQKFPAASESELNGVLDWVMKMNPSPSGGNGAPPRQYHGTPGYQSSFKPIVPIQKTAIEQAEWWTSGARLEPDAMMALSPVGIPEQPSEYAALAFSSLYQEGDHLNIVCKHVVDGEKARPLGGGKIMKRDAWVKYFEASGVPHSDAGAWIRLNPCNAAGTGADEAVTDADVSAFRFVLLESDDLPIAVQLALYKRFKLPIAAIILSGGASAHAWVRLNASTIEQFRELVVGLFSLLKPFGIDQANRNASRLCRLPGAIRKIGAVGDGEQRLIWLNPNAAPLTSESLRTFEETLAFPYIDAKPLAPIAREAVTRYEWMVANRGALGVTTGIPQLDAISGGFKKGQTIVIAGETGGGKSTLAMHVIRAALDSGVGVGLFSLEMDREEVFDLMVASYAGVNRNCFNNGSFTPQDINAIAGKMGKVSSLPLYIEDSALTGPEQIKARTFQLKADGKIGLVVVDYIQFVNPGMTRDSREQQIAGISHTLRAIARESQLPFIVLSQLNEEGKLRESRVIAHNANIVMLVQIDGDKFVVKVVKGRGIPLGEYALTYDRQFARLVPDQQTVNEDAVEAARRAFRDN